MTQQKVPIDICNKSPIISNKDISREISYKYCMNLKELDEKYYNFKHDLNIDHVKSQPFVQLHFSRIISKEFKT